MKILLRTQRVAVREFTEADADSLFALDHDPDVLRFTSENALDRVESYRTMIREVYLPFYRRYAHYGYWAAEERASGTFIGWFCLHPGAEAGEAAALLEFADDDVEIGYRLRRFAWGKNYATEVTCALMVRSFCELGVKRIVATTSSMNLASIRVLEKAGLKRAPRLFDLPWATAPYVKYSLSRDEYACI